MRAGRVKHLVVCILSFTASRVLADGPPRSRPEPEDRFLVLYEVDELLGQRDFEAPRLGVSIPKKGDSGLVGLDEEKRKERREKELRELAESLRTVAAEKDGEVMIRQVGPPLRLAVSSTKAGHRLIQRRIRRLAVDRQTHIAVNLAVVPVHAGLLKDLEEDRRRKLESELPRLRSGEKVELPSALIDELIRRTASRYDASYHLPRVTAWNGQLSHSLIINQAALIAGLKVEERAGKKFGTPVIGVLNTGVISEIRPVVVDDGEGVRLDLRFQFAEQTGADVKLASEIEAYRDLEGANEIPLQFPRLRRVGFETSAVAPLDRWVLLGGTSGAIRIFRKGEKPEEEAKDGFTLFFARITVMAAEDAGGNEKPKG